MLSFLIWQELAEERVIAISSELGGLSLDEAERDRHDWWRRKGTRVGRKWPRHTLVATFERQTLSPTSSPRLTFHNLRLRSLSVSTIQLKNTWIFKSLLWGEGGCTRRFLYKNRKENNFYQNLLNIGCDASRRQGSRARRFLQVLCILSRFTAK